MLVRDFLTKVGMVLGFAGGGYREGVYTILKPFAKAPPATCPIANTENGHKEVSKASPTCNRGKPSRKLLVSVCRLANQVANYVLASARVLTWTLVARNVTHKLVANIAGLSARKRAQLTSLLNDFDKLFTTRPGCTKLVWHRIDTGNVLPYKVNLRPVSLSKIKAVDTCLEELVATGVLQHSKSLWGFPAMVVPKKGGPSRLCMDIVV